MAAGMNSLGIAGAGGFGRALAEWIADGILSFSFSLLAPYLLISHIQENLLVISGNLTSLDSVRTLPIKIIYVIEQQRPWVDITPYHGLTGKWNQDGGLRRLHSIPDWRLKVPALVVFMAGKDPTGLQKKEVRIFLEQVHYYNYRIFHQNLERMN